MTTNIETLNFFKKRIIENLDNLSARQLKRVADFTDEVYTEESQ
jgi:hypothetical protein